MTKDQMRFMIARRVAWDALTMLETLDNLPDGYAEHAAHLRAMLDKLET